MARIPRDIAPAAAVRRPPIGLDDGPLSRGAAAVASAALVVAVIGAMAFVLLFGGKIVPGVRAAGVTVGGMAPAEASLLVAQQTRALATTPVELRAGELAWRPTAAEVGVRPDPDAIVDRAFDVGRVGSPIERSLSLAAALVGAADVAPPAVDRAALRAWVARAAGAFDRPAVDATIELLPSGELKTTPEQIGRRIDQARAGAQVEAALSAWQSARFAGEVAALEPIALPFETLAPRVTAADLAATRAEAERVIARPVRLRVDELAWELERREVAALLSVRRDGALTHLDVVPGRLEGLVARIAQEVEREPVDAKLSIAPEGKVRFTPDESGRRVMQEAAVAQLSSALLAQTAGPLELALPVARIPASVRSDDLAATKAELERALAGPVKLAAADRSATLAPEKIAAAIALVPNVDGRVLAARFDAAAFRPVLEELAKEVDRAPRHARLRLVGGSGAGGRDVVASMPAGGAGARLETIEEGKPGRRLNVDAAVAALKAGIFASARPIELPVETVRAITAADAGLFGPLELIEYGTTTYAGGIPERNHNVELAASRLDGVVVPPGATFSFNRALGPTTVENGYRVAWGIMAGKGENAPPKTVPSVGGGICQIATTLFHAVFWAGYPIEERNWHLYWIPKYGAPPKGLKGLDATVDEAYGVDFKWTNATDGPVLIQARTDGGRVSFGLYGARPEWKVDVSGPTITNVVKAKTEIVRQPEPSMPRGQTLNLEEARDGFRATIVRSVTGTDGEVRSGTFTSEYQPSRNVVLVGTGGAAPKRPTATG